MKSVLNVGNEKLLGMEKRFVAERQGERLAIFHEHIKIISRGQGRSAVAAAAYRSGSKFKSEYDGEVHDYTKKSGIGHCEILLPKFAPERLKDRLTLWNEVERVEKAKDSQLAREIEVSIPVEIPESQWVDLMREYCQKNFVDRGMIADTCIHKADKNNPHCHIMLTVRPFNQDGTWGAKCKKEYLYDEKGNKKLDKNGKPKSRRVDTTDWNKRENSELWRKNWADICNSYLDKVNSHEVGREGCLGTKNGQVERIDHRSYERQGKEEIPNIHNSIAVKEMEKRGQKTDRGETHREISSVNKDLAVMRARVTRLKAWQKEVQTRPFNTEIANVKLGIKHVMESEIYNNPKYRTLTNLKNSTKAMSFLSDNNITDLNSFMDEISKMNDSYYVLRGEIQKIDKQETILKQKISLAEEYKEHHKILKKFDSMSPKEQKEYRKKHGDKLAQAEQVRAKLKAVLNEGEKINVKDWKKDLATLGSHKNVANWKADGFKDELRRAELLRELFEEVAKEQTLTQEQQKNKNRGQDR